MLPNAPDTALDADHRPRFGTYVGTIPAVDLGPLTGRLRRIATLKRWQYVITTTPEVLLAFAVVDLGYAANAFLFVADRKGSGLVFDESWLGVPGLGVAVGNRAGEGATARFSLPGVRFRFAIEGTRGTFAVRARGIELEASFSPSGPPPMTLVAKVEGGQVNTTRKAALYETHGRLRVGERWWSLDGGHTGLDWTHGLLARKTSWRWAFLQGKAVDGTLLAVNLCEGFTHGPTAEDALWTPEGVEVLPPCVFGWDADDTLRPWTMKSADGRVDLAFRAIGQHREHRDLGLASSRFVQVAGEYSGKIIDSRGRTLELAGVPGVTEDQRVKW